MKIQRLVWKSETFGPSEPHIVVEVGNGSFGVWAAQFTGDGRATGSARPVGAGCRLTEAEALAGAKLANTNARRVGVDRY
jgi:hypothetical protein